ncbi:Chaperone protein ClpB1 [Apostasia shenzhenica]|uniref:Chaperone protein ClpB1 n=1 Tax=Apostasia shenzhenica TaxID=1088818 RepID=A0A2I0A8N5_9ASPA|nr:Chaperone protein ClpB1 [Apostasia shenzhenica]
MPTSVSTARQCLAGEASAALDAAVSAARRRSHAQTTSLHVVFALLSSSSPSLLRDALTRARSSAYSPRLQFRALELCFGVALDRLPSSSSSPAAAPSPSQPDEPPVSNSLMAAIKRSQANQRRHPDTFHLYQQQQSAANSSSAFAGVKVELQQLVLAILDDPIVSRVFGEAGFRNCDIKLAVLRPPPPILRFPRAARCPPLFLCNFSAGEGFGFPFPSAVGAAHLFADAADENCRRIAEVLNRSTGDSRNPILVGVGAAEAVGDFSRAVKRRNWASLPPEIRGLRIGSFERELAGGGAVDDVKASISGLLEEVSGEVEEPGAVVSIGDLKELVEGREEVGDFLVSELTKALELRRGRLWVMGWSATYESYLKFLSRYPLLDKDWDLQLLPITSQRSSMGGLPAKPPGTRELTFQGIFVFSLVDSFVPFGGLFPQSYEPIGTLNNPYQSLPRCHNCNEKYEEEVADVMKDKSASLEDQQQANLPSRLHRAYFGVMKEGCDNSKAKGDGSVLNAKIADLQKKWNEYCQGLHRGSQIIDANNYSVLPHLVGIPYASETVNFSKLSSNTSATHTQICSRSGFAISTGLPKATDVNQNISSTSASEPINRDLISKLQEKPSKSEPVMAGGFQSPSDWSIQDGHNSPTSATSVTTDLVLGAVNDNSSFEQKTAPLAHVERSKGSPQCSTRRQVDESGSGFHLHTSPCSHPKSPAKVSSGHADSFSFTKAQNGIFSLDASNCKSFYRNLVANVGRQEEALWSISEAIIHCRTTHEKRHLPIPRGDIWLSFLGPDRVGKKMAALALAELIFGSWDSCICIDLSDHDDFACQNRIFHRHGLKEQNAGSRGKITSDHIAMEISRKPLSVFFLENVDKADLLAQSSLITAIQTGKFSDSHGREFSISSSIFVTTAKALSMKDSPKENVFFSEERILAAHPQNMKILVEPLSGSLSRCKRSTVSISSEYNPKWKRKLGSSGHDEEQDDYFTAVKKPNRSSSISLDLNLPAVDDFESSCSENNSTNENSQEWLDEFSGLLDQTVCFKPFDFDSLADYVLKEISKAFLNTIGSNHLLEIDVKVMEQILAATWLMRDRRDLSDWIEKALCRSFLDLRNKYKLSDCIMLKLVPNLDSAMEESESGLFLPSRIDLG